MPVIFYTVQRARSYLYKFPTTPVKKDQAKLGITFINHLICGLALMPGHIKLKETLLGPGFSSIYQDLMVAKKSQGKNSIQVKLSQK